MTRTLLHISASPNAADSISRTVALALIERLGRAAPVAIRDRDLARDPPPVPTDLFAKASLSPHPPGAADDGVDAAYACSEALIAELAAASMVVFSMPMHNFTVPAVLKAWIDLVVRPGRTFRITREGKIGLLDDRPVFVVMSAGGPLDAGVGRQQDFLTPYLRYVLKTIGLLAPAILCLDSQRRGAAQIEHGQAKAQAWIEHEADRWAASLSLV